MVSLVEGVEMLNAFEKDISSSVEIVSMIKVLMGPKLKGDSDKTRVFRYGQLRRIASVVR